jgi:hypothetical protein
VWLVNYADLSEGFGQSLTVENLVFGLKIQLDLKWQTQLTTEQINKFYSLT